MSASRRTKVATALALVAISAGLLVVGAPPVGAIDQPGPTNYAGPGSPAPGQCPPGTSIDDNTCVITNDNVNVNQVGQSNEVDCKGASCIATQIGPSNTATCDDSAFAQEFEQLCQIEQQGDQNTITATLIAEATTDDILTQQEVTQTLEQRFITTQNGGTNELHVTGEITERATTNLDAPVVHTQRTLQRSYNKMFATQSNTATYELDRTQASNATGTLTTQLQDHDPADPTPGEPDGVTSKVGLSEINLVADSDGWNSITIDGLDSKTQNATAASPVGDPPGSPTAKQTQGYDAGGGLLTTLAIESAQQSPIGLGLDFDIGEPNNPDDGLRKVWLQSAEVLPTATKEQNAFDFIKIPQILRSGFKGRSNQFCDIETDVGGHIEAGQAASGHAKGEGWTGQGECFLDAGKPDEVGSEHKHPKFGFENLQDVAFSFSCKVNDNICPLDEGSGHAHMAVANVSNNQGFDGDASHPSGPTDIQAQDGQTVRYAAVFHNPGAPATIAKNVDLRSSIPVEGELVGCSDNCASDDQSVSWNVGNVAGGSPVVRTFDVKIDPGTAVGTTITNSTTGEFGPEDARVPFQSNDTTVTITSIMRQDVDIQIFGEEKKAPGVIPVAIFTNPNDTKPDGKDVNPSTVCFGDIAEGECDATETHNRGHLKDIDGDKDIDLVLHYELNETGIDPNEETACLTGATFEGTPVIGCAPLPKG